MARFQPRHLGEPSISRAMIATHIHVALYGVLHSNMTDDEKVSAMGTLAELARDLNGYWKRSRKFWGLGSERLLYRLCGLDLNGEVPDELLRRIVEVSQSPQVWDGDDA